NLFAVGEWYDEFGQLTDEQVIRILDQAQTTTANPTELWEPASRQIRIPAGAQRLDGILSLPEQPIGLVLFAHGSGSSRLSPRNQRVAAALQRQNIATLLFDLLTPDEERRDSLTAELRFDVELLAHRLEAALDWTTTQPDIARLAVGCFGAST